MFDTTILAAIIGVVGAAAIGTVVDRIRLGVRVTVLEALFHEKSKNVTELEAVAGLHSNRITAIESVVPELRRLIESLRDVPGVLSSLKDMMMNDRERVRDMEQHVFPFNRPKE